MWLRGASKSPARLGGGGACALPDFAVRITILRGKNKVATVKGTASCVTRFGKLKFKVVLDVRAEAFGQGFWS
jgi:hypothetical protein